MKTFYLTSSNMLIALYSLLVSMGADKASSAGILHVSNVLHFRSIGQKEFSVFSLLYYPLVIIGIFLAILSVIFIALSSACDNGGDI